MLEAAGWPDRKGALMETARALHIPHATLSRWSRHVNNPPPAKTVRVKTFDLREAIRAELQSILHYMPDAIPDAEYKELGTVLGILVDKLQLLEGKATERVELLSEQERTDRLADLLNAARTRRDGRDSELLQ